MAHDKRITFIRQKCFFPKEKDILGSIRVNVKGKKLHFLTKCHFWELLPTIGPLEKTW